jgi:hypothetical protein
MNRSTCLAAFCIVAMGLVTPEAIAAPPKPNVRVQAAGAPAFPVFPPDNVWNTRIDDLPVDPQSNAYINRIGASDTVHPDFGSGTWNGGPIGIPFVTVGGNQPLVPISFYYADESDSGPYPFPASAPIEGGSRSRGDRHVLVIDVDNGILYEAWKAYPLRGGTRWYAGSGATFDLNSNALRPDGWTSADAAGLPILAGLVQFDQVASGEIRHALRFTVQETRRAYVWPARHYASDSDDPDLPPMGQRFRLRSNYPVAGHSPQVQVILVCLQRYGMFLADNGSNWYLSGVPDERWDNDVLHELHDVQGSDFEAVDQSSLMIDPDSAQAWQGP